MFSTPLYIFATFCFISVLCEKKPCDLADEKCLTVSANKSFEQFIAGIAGTESSDPLYEDVITVDIPKLYVQYTEGKLTGMKKCHVELVRISPTDLKYNYHIGCPHVIFEAKYELKTELGPEPVEGKGTSHIDFYDYHFLLSGESEKTVGADGKAHIQLKNHVLDIEAKGKVQYDYKDLFNGDEEKTKKLIQWANENWVEVDKIIRQPVMGAFMKKYVKHVNDYLKIVSVEELFNSE